MARGGVLDLRQNRPIAAPIRQAPQPAAPKSPSLADSLEASAVPATSHSEAEAPVKPVAPPLPVSPLKAPVVPANDASLRPRRFWPAFWRFLVLLIVFGVLVTGGVYLYLTYVKH
jgi:hypothetical protein